MDTLNVKCPCCKAVLTVNRETGLILHTEEYKKGPAEFDSFLDKQRQRKDEISRKFEASKEKSKSNLKNIEEKIAYAKKRVDEEEGKA